MVSDKFMVNSDAGRMAAARAAGLVPDGTELGGEWDAGLEGSW
jgi:hypothetical protein